MSKPTFHPEPVVLLHEGRDLIIDGEVVASHINADANLIRISDEGARIDLAKRSFATGRTFERRLTRNQRRHVALMGANS